MSEVKTFFRICPACGRRFHIKVVSKKLADDKSETVEMTQPAVISTFPQMRGGAPLIVEENVPVTIDVEEFQYSYHCKHCGHEWSEIHR